MTDVSWLVLMALSGLLAGSVLNCVIWRLPLMLRRAETGAMDDGLPARFNLFLPRSCCPRCLNTIPFYHNLPVISWLLLRGRCHRCGSPIGLRYPLTELATALCTAWVAWYWPPGWSALCLALGTWLLIALVCIDMKHMLLPDVLTLPLLWLGLLANLSGAVAPLDDAVIGAVAGYLILWCVYWGFLLLTGREGLGYGDFKLLAALGSWCGWQRLPALLLGASLAGIILILLLRLTGRTERGAAFPFGPCLAAAGWWLAVTPSATW